MDVLRAIAHGDTNDEIANGLNLSVNTVRCHVQSVLKKLDAHSKVEAVSKALRDGMI